MAQAVEMGSAAMVCIPVFRQVGSGIRSQWGLGGGGIIDTLTYTQMHRHSDTQIHRDTESMEIA
jgi:hypothetical protein